MTNPNDKETKGASGVASSELLALSSILGGLLASGHYTDPSQADDNPNEDFIKRDRGIDGLYIRAIDDAEFLLMKAKNLLANGDISQNERSE